MIVHASLSKAMRKQQQHIIVYTKFLLFFFIPWLKSATTNKRKRFCARMNHQSDLVQMTFTLKSIESRRYFFSFNHFHEFCVRTARNFMKILIFLCAFGLFYYSNHKYFADACPTNSFSFSLSLFCASFAYRFKTIAS